MIGAKVLGIFVLTERKFHRSESSKVRMFHWTKVLPLWTIRSWEQKCRETKSPTFC